MSLPVGSDAGPVRGAYGLSPVPASPSEAVVGTVLINRVSWGAVLAGVVIALVVQLLLNMLGVGIGAATLDPGTADNPSTASFSIGAGIWFLASGIVASLASGYVAGRLSGQPRRSTAGWHGLTAWAVTTLVIFYLLTSAIGGIIGGVYGTFTRAAGSVASTVGATAQTAAQVAAPNLSALADPFSSIEQSIRTNADRTDPAALRDAAVSAMRALVTGDEAQAAQARDQAAQAIAAARNQPVEQARADVQRYEQQYRQTVDNAKRQATAAAEATAKATSRAALFGALGLILGALAGWLGGRMGTIQPGLHPSN
ncbi:hypothetical protein [Microvirga pudoricolor]|uniref:hypothetical protein n=1 Tax=Microvirga pudoricolor TaxID=2778729 RepID=UPI00194E180C|nr:hypothetical protein [Microvirga pudoricolor]MBM6596781.1 hypothetical protein [Microvirga pudoricolor]